MHLVELEYRARWDRGEANVSIGAEAQVLSEWLRNTHPDAPRLTPKTITNRLRHEHQGRTKKTRKCFLMPIGKLVFAQLMDFLPLHTFRRCVARYPSNYPTKAFSHLDQYLSMAFAQLTFRESLRDIEVCLRAHEAKLYHLGIRGHVARSNLGDANEKRDWRIYRDFANSLIAQARRLYADDAFAVDLDNSVYALDTTTIDLSLKCFRGHIFARPKLP